MQIFCFLIYNYFATTLSNNFFYDGYAVTSKWSKLYSFFNPSYLVNNDFYHSDSSMWLRLIINCFNLASIQTTNIFYRNIDRFHYKFFTLNKWYWWCWNETCNNNFNFIKLQFCTNKCTVCSI